MGKEEKRVGADDWEWELPRVSLGSAGIGVTDRCVDHTHGEG
jgi:hypothetical protein